MKGTTFLQSHHFKRKSHQSIKSVVNNAVLVKLRKSPLAITNNQLVKKIRKKKVTLYSTLSGLSSDDFAGSDYNFVQSRGQQDR